MKHKQAISRRIDQHRDMLIDVSTRIHREPELGHQEHKASRLLTGRLKEHGYETRLGVSGMDTAFTATIRGRGEGPNIGILAEYDALPAIGHACTTTSSPPPPLGPPSGSPPSSVSSTAQSPYTAPQPRRASSRTPAAK